MDKKKIADAIRLLLEGLGEDTHRQGIRKTPERFAGFCDEIFFGYQSEPPEVKVFREENVPETVAIDDISFTSFCEHHLVPFHGKISIAYQPADKRICGFNDILSVCDYFAARLQLQERLTNDIGHYLFRQLNPKSLQVEIRAEHFCMKLHAPRKESGTVTTIFRR